MYNSNDIAIRIKEVAKAKHVVISEMLDRINLSKNTMSNFKTSMPKADNLAKIADYLDCSIDYLMGRTDIMEFSHKPINKQMKNAVRMTILPYYRTPSSAGSGSILFDDVPVEYINVPKNAETEKADFVVEVRGDSMEPQFYNGDHVLVAADRIIQAGEIGVFVLDGDSFIKKMGEGRLISLNPAYAPIELHEYDSIQCAGKVIGTIDLQ